MSAGARIQVGKRQIRVGSLRQQLLNSDLVISNFVRRFGYRARSDLVISDLARSDLMISDLARSDFVISDFVREFIFWTGSDFMISDLARSDFVISDLTISDFVISDLARSDLVISYLVRDFIYRAGSDFVISDLARYDLVISKLCGGYRPNLVWCFTLHYFPALRVFSLRSLFCRQCSVFRLIGL